MVDEIEVSIGVRQITRSHFSGRGTGFGLGSYNFLCGSPLLDIYAADGGGHEIGKLVGGAGEGGNADAGKGGCIAVVEGGCAIVI